ncbi:MAG: hypothetical protein KDA21_08505 [Phycisphaerales bacterium]|nr:hypothetical protein [Phycisphaerales bacterium]
MTAPRLSLFILLPLLAMLGACASTHTSEESVALAPVPLALDVNNFRGGVTVRVDASRTDALVRSSVWVEADTPRSEIASIMDAVDINVSLEDHGGRAVLRVVTASAADVEWEHRVDLVVELPRCDGIRVRTEGGHIVAIDTDGSTTLENRGGGIDFRTSHPVDEPMTLTAVDGSIFAAAPLTSRGVVDLETLEGKVKFKDFGAGVDEAYASVRNFSGTINQGSNPIVCRTNDGDIWLRLDDDPIAYVPPLGWWYPRDVEGQFFLGGSYRWTRNLPDDDLPEPIEIDYPY